MTLNRLPLADYPLQAYEKLRYADTDRQGHVNNAVFATMLETGRVELLYGPEGVLHDGGDCAFVIASLHLDFLGEIRWPGLVEIGTRVASIGNSSLTLEQGLFQEGGCVATAKNGDCTDERVQPPLTGPDRQGGAAFAQFVAEECLRQAFFFAGYPCCFFIFSQFQGQDRHGYAQAHPCG